MAHFLAGNRTTNEPGFRPGLSYARDTLMAPASTARGTGGNTASSTMPVCTPASDPAAGSLLVLVLALDNTGSSGPATPVLLPTQQGNPCMQGYLTNREPRFRECGHQALHLHDPAECRDARFREHNHRHVRRARQRRRGRSGRSRRQAATTPATWSSPSDTTNGSWSTAPCAEYGSTTSGQDVARERHRRSSGGWLAAPAGDGAGARGALPWYRHARPGRRSDRRPTRRAVH